MKVTLVSYTPDAVNLLLRTKNTRLGEGEDPASWPEEKKAENLRYMLGTIKSSWEFVDYVFHTEDVTRAFTQQLERTRAGSYAEQSLRVVDARDFGVIVPKSVAKSPSEAIKAHWVDADMFMRAAYGALIDGGVPIQDARGLLPINIGTALYTKLSLRTLHEMARVRLCTRTQGEYQDVFRAMRSEVLSVHPWAEDFIQVECVASGTCAFPNYGPSGCPVWLPELNRDETKAKMRNRFWAIRHEADPGVKR